MVGDVLRGQQIRLGLQLFPKTLRQTFYFASAENFDGC
jgi:hypothetical protein